MLLCIIITCVTLSILVRSRVFVVNPDITTVDKTILVIQNSNTQLSNSITLKQQELTTLNQQVNTLQQTISNLQSALATALANATTQIVAPPPDHQLDPELSLLVTLREDLLTYMTPNIVTGTVYLKTSTFYHHIDSLISTYLGATQLTLSEFMTEFTDTHAQNFRQAIQTIFDNTLPYNFDTFYDAILNPTF